MASTLYWPRGTLKVDHLQSVIDIYDMNLTESEGTYTTSLYYMNITLVYIFNGKATLIEDQYSINEVAADSALYYDCVKGEFVEHDETAGPLSNDYYILICSFIETVYDGVVRMVPHLNMELPCYWELHQESNTDNTSLTVTLTSPSDNNSTVTWTLSPDEQTPPTFLVWSGDGIVALDIVETTLNLFLLMEYGYTSLNTELSSIFIGENQDTEYFYNFYNNE